MASAVVGTLRVLLTANSAEFDTAMKAAAKSADAFTKDLKSIGQQATNLGSALTRTLTAPILGIGVLAAKSAIDFESAFAGVRKTVDGTVDKFGNLTKAGQEIQQGLRDMAKEIPVNVIELTKIAESAGQLGIAKEDILQFTRVMADLSVTTNLTSEQAATSIAQIQNIFGAAGKDVDRFGATLVALGNAGASTEKNIVEMAARIAGAGHSVGLTQAQVLSFASSLSSVGINAEAGGSAISRVFLKINDAVMSGGPALAEFARVSGMTAAQFKQAFEKDAAGATVTFIEGLKRLKGTGENVNATMEGLIGKNIILKDTLNRLSGAGELLRRDLALGNKAWQENTALINEARERYKTTESMLKVLGQQINDVGITIGNALLPTIHLTIQAFGRLIPIVDAVAKTFAALPTWMQATAIAVALAVAAIGPLLFIAGQLITATATLTTAFGTAGIATRALTALYPALTTATAAQSAANVTAGTTATVAAGGVSTLRLALVALGTTFAAILTVGTTVAMVVEAIGQAAKLSKENIDRENSALSESARQHAMIARAAEISGHSVHGYADAVLIVTEYTRKNWEELRRQVEETKRATAATAEWEGPLQDVAGAAKTYGDELKAVRSEIAKFTPEQKQAIADGLALGHSQKEIAGSLKISEEALKLYTSGVKDAGKASNDLAKDTEKLAATTREYYNWLGEREIEAIEANNAKLEAQMTAWREYYNWLGERRMEDDAAALAADKKLIASRLEAMGLIQPGFENASTRYTPLIPGAFPDRDNQPLGDQSAPKQFLAWDAQIGELSKSLAQLAEISGETFGGMTQWLATVVSSMNAGRQASVALSQGFDQLRAGGIENVIGGLANIVAGSMAAVAAIGQATGQGSTLQRTLGGIATGAKIGSAILPGWGTAIGAVIGGLVGVVRGIFGVSDAVKKARTELEGFQSKLRGTLTDTQKAEAGTEAWKMDVIRVRDAYLSTGRTAAEAEAVVRRLWNTDNPDDMQRAIAEINTALVEEKRLADEAAAAIEAQALAFEDAKEEAGGLIDEIVDLAGAADGLPKSLIPYINQLLAVGLITQEQADRLHGLRTQGEVDWEAMQAAAERYGIDLDSLGGRFQGARLHRSAQEIINDFGLLTRGGADVGGVLLGMSDEIANLVRDSIRFGTTIPANMRPWIQELTRSGHLLDENGNKIENLDKLNFGEELKDEALIAREGFAGIIAKLDELIARITGPLTAALDNITKDRTVHIDVDYDIGPPPLPSTNPDRNVPFARGGLVTSATSALIGEAGPELVIPLSRLAEVVKPFADAAQPVSSRTWMPVRVNVVQSDDLLKAVKHQTITTSVGFVNAISRFISEGKDKLRSDSALITAVNSFAPGMHEKLRTLLAEPAVSLVTAVNRFVPALHGRLNPVVVGGRTELTPGDHGKLNPAPTSGGTQITPGPHEKLNPASLTGSTHLDPGPHARIVSQASLTGKALSDLWGGLKPWLDPGLALQPVPIPDFPRGFPFDSRIDERTGNREAGGDRNTTNVHPLVVLVPQGRDADSIIREIKQGFGQAVALNEYELRTELSSLLLQGAR